MSKKLFVTTAGAVYAGDGTKLSNDWNSLTNTQKEALFDSATAAPFSGLTGLGSIKAYVYSTSATAYHTLSITGVPDNQTVVPSGLIDLSNYTRLMSASITYTTSGNGAIKILVTPDKSTYYTYNFTTQAWVQTSLVNIHASGIPVAQLGSIGEWSIFDEAGKIGFAYGLSIESTSDDCEVDQIDLTVDANGCWAHATDSQATYKYQGNTTLVVTLSENGDYKINYQE